MRLLRHPTVKRHLDQGMKFMISGVIGATIEFSIITLLVKGLQWHPSAAYIPSGLCAVVFVFLFNKYVTFRSDRRDPRELLRFAMVYGVAFILNYILANFFLWLMGSVLQMSVYKTALLAKALAIGAVAVVNYFLSHGFIFKKAEAVQMPL